MNEPIERIRIPVVEGPRLRTSGKDIPTLIGSMPLEVLVPDPVAEQPPRMEIPYRNTAQQQGYQRNASPKRVNDLQKALRENEVDLPTAVLLNLRGVSVDDITEDAGGHRYLVVERRDWPSPFYIVDGQHRLRALERLAAEEGAYARWRHYPIPFVCMVGANELQEMEQFYVVNSTAKSVKTDLALDLLKQQTEHAPALRVHLIAQNRIWQVRGQEIVEVLARQSAPWQGRVRFPNEGLGQTTVTNSALVNSLKPLLAPHQYVFGNLALADQVKTLDAFWCGIQRCLPDAFETPRAYALQKGPGVFALHSVFGHVFEYVRAEGLSVLDPEDYASVMEKPLQNLEGETPAGALVSGPDFWRSREGAAAAYSSHAGRRVLSARIQNLLPALKVQ